MTQILKDIKESVIETSSDRRKAKRLFLTFPIEISGIDQAGYPFRELTKTDEISESGCRLATTIPFKRGDLLDIRLVSPQELGMPEESPQQFEIVWVHPTKTGWSIGARKVQVGKIWKVVFPPKKSSS